MILLVSLGVLVVAGGLFGAQIGWRLGTREIYQRPFEEIDTHLAVPALFAVTYAHRARDRAIRTALYATLSGAATGAATLAVLPL